VAVTGATGEVGGRVARALAEQGVPQLLVVRDLARAPELPGAEPRQTAGYADRDAMRRALEGAGTLFLVPGHESRDRVGEHRAALEAAADAGVRRVVYLSFLGAAPDSTFTFGRDHWHTEQLVREGGFESFTFVRMSWYMDFIPTMVGDDGVIRGPAGDGRVSAVLRDDVAACVAATLTSDGHDGATYDATGPDAFTLTEAAEAMSSAWGRRIAFQDETLEEAYESRSGFGAPRWEVDGWVTSYAAIGAGELAKVSDDVRRLTGRRPTSLREYLSR
jgi:uncharacterized protein YbjT (DUF2867 family)